MFTITTRSAVRKVASYLDEDRPNWVERVTRTCGENLEHLRCSGYPCVFTEVYGNWSADLVKRVARRAGVAWLTVGRATACAENSNGRLRRYWLAEVNRRRHHQSRPRTDAPRVLVDA